VKLSNLLKNTPKIIDFQVRNKFVFNILTFFNHNGVSIDDYCICSSSFLSNIVNFQVEEFIPNLSDHCPITVNVLSQYSENISSSTLRPLPFNIKWTKDVENKFVSIR
jgi:hypothetical protein